MTDRSVSYAIIAIVAGSLVCTAHGALLAQTPRADERVAALVGKLGDAKYDARLEADRELARLGSAARRELEAAATHADPEIRLQAKDLLRRLNTERLWAGSVVSLDAEHRHSSQAVESLRSQSGNSLLLGDQYGTFHDADVRIELGGVPFWHALDELCRQAGARVRPHYDTRKPGLVLTSGTPTACPVAYSGPVRMQIVQGRRVFHEELDYDDLSSETAHTFQLNLQAMWEDQFRLAAYRAHPEIIEAVTDAGQVLASNQSPSSGWNVAGTATRQVSMSLRMEPPPTTAERLATLRLRWGLIAVGDMAAFEIQDLASKAPHFHDDVELVVESVESASGRWDIALLVIRDFVVPEPQDILFQENVIDLLDQHGRAFRLHGQSNSAVEHGARMKLSFLAPEDGSRPERLRFEYPKIRSTRDLEIVFHDVPLPVARPE